MFALHWYEHVLMACKGQVNLEQACSSKIGNKHKHVERFIEATFTLTANPKHIYTARVPQHTPVIVHHNI